MGRRFVTVGLAAALAVAGLGAGAAEESDGPPLSGEFARKFRLLDEPFPAPDYAFEDADGNAKALVEFKGQVVLAMFWATWCGVCAREMPKLDRLQAKFGGNGLVVVPLAQDGDPAKIRAWFRERGVEDLPVYRDEVLGGLLGIRGVPTTFLIDKAGRMVGVAQGAAPWESKEATALLRHYLDEG